MNSVLLKKLIKEIASQQLKKKLYIFDWDETLIRSQSRIFVQKMDGSVLKLTPAEYTDYIAEPGDKFDYKEFRGTIRKPQIIKWTMKVLKDVIAKYGAKSAMILTARGSAQPVREFLSKKGIPPIKIIALGSTPENPASSGKASYILNLIKDANYDEVVFFDDSLENVTAVKNLQRQVSNTTKIIVHKV